MNTSGTSAHTILAQKTGQVFQIYSDRDPQEFAMSIDKVMGAPQCDEFLCQLAWQLGQRCFNCDVERRELLYPVSNRVVEIVQPVAGLF